MNERTRRWRCPLPALLALASALCVGTVAGCDRRATPRQEEALAAGRRADDQEPRAAPPPKAPALATVPLPNLSNLDQAVQQQLGDRQASLSALRKRPGVPAGELSTAFGEMGKLYHAYELLDAAEACYRNARTLTPDDFRWPYYLGHLYRTKGQLGEAIAAFDRAVAIRPDSLPALVALAQTHLLANQPGRAEPLFQRALAEDPSCAPAMVGLGKIASSRREFAAAVRHFESALALRPKATAIHYPLAMAYRSLGEVTKAREHLLSRGETTATVADPLMAELPELLTGIRHHEKRGVSAGKAGQLSSALKELRKAVQADPRSPSAHLNLGTALAKSGDPDAAIEEFHEALRLKPGLARAHCNLGVLLAQRGSSAEAVEQFRRAIRSDPQYLGAHLGLADVLVEIGSHELAAAHYARVIEIDPRHRAARLGQAVALSRIGRYADARARLENARIVLPESMILAHALARLLAACPDQTVRDGPRAVRLARAVFKTRQSIEHAETVAMAYAEVGQYDQAKRWQGRAIAAAEEARRENLLPRLRENLARYQRRRPCRVPWPEKTAP